MNLNRTSKIEALDNVLPKSCPQCGTTYHSIPEFYNKTEPLKKGSFSEGPKGSILIYRNCPCGTTVTLKLKERRDMSQTGIELRERFRAELQSWIEKGKTRKEAEELVREELGLHHL